MSWDMLDEKEMMLEKLRHKKLPNKVQGSSSQVYPEHGMDEAKRIDWKCLLLLRQDNMLQTSRKLDKKYQQPYSAQGAGSTGL